MNLNLMNSEFESLSNNNSMNSLLYEPGISEFMEFKVMEFIHARMNSEIKEGRGRVAAVPATGGHYVRRRSTGGTVPELEGLATVCNSLRLRGSKQQPALELLKTGDKQLHFIERTVFVAETYARTAGIFDYRVRELGLDSGLRVLISPFPKKLRHYRNLLLCRCLVPTSRKRPSVSVFRHSARAVNFLSASSVASSSSFQNPFPVIF